MKKYQSIVDEKMRNNFSKIHGCTLMNHVANSYDIEMAIGFAALFCPEIVEVDGCIFIAEFYNGNIQELKKAYKTVREIEMFVNSWSLTSLLKDNDDIDYSIGFIDEFAKAIQYFWQMRLNILFPDKRVVVEIGEEIMGEEGMAVTLYQKDKN
ncbi:MAG: hypothetical protein NC417_08440 [Candidatus Gastranaerophilales bacterium]|nr:hypothetical protein [Candidatus Gastranaerophilales bacterium]